MPKYSCKNCNTLAELLESAERRVHNLIRQCDAHAQYASELEMEIMNKNLRIAGLEELARQMSGAKKETQ